MRALTMEFLVINMLQRVNEKEYYPQTRELERDVRQCSELPDRIRNDQIQYSTLQRFFGILSEKANSWTYDHAMCGAQSPYTVLLGW